MDLIPSRFTNNSIESYLIKVTSRSRIIYWIVIITALCGMFMLPFVKVDVSATARGSFQPGITIQVVYTPCQGKVIYSSVEEGRMISRGDTLFMIQSEALKTRKEATVKEIFENSCSIEDLEKLTLIEYPVTIPETGTFLTSRYNSEYSDFIKSWNIQLQRYLRSRAEYERAEILHKQEIITETEFERSLQAFRLDEEDLHQTLTYRKSLWHADMMLRRNLARSMDAELNECAQEMADMIILAPVSGKIIKSVNIQPGMLINSNQMVAEILPSGDLVALCKLSPKDIGLVKLGQKVKLQVDALNYNEWGLLDAIVSDISYELTSESESGAYYSVKCKPASSCLLIGNGVSAELKKGMSFSARIMVSRRSLLNLLFDKTGSWLDPYLAKSK